MWKQGMADKLKAARNGESQKIIEAYHTMTGKSPQTLYRIAKKHGFTSGRKKRCDMGSCELTDKQIDFITAQIHTTTRELKGPITPVAKALRDAEKNGIISAGKISAARLQSILRERNMNAAALKTPEPHIKMRSLHPNHVHVYDASVCIQYYLKGRKGLRMMREDIFYKNKWQNFAVVKDKLHRYILVDHFSHAIFIKYYYTGGETQENLFDFLISAWSLKDEKFPFRGVPFYMLWDAGAANTAGAMKEFIHRLEIKTPESLPHNPRRQGSAEVAQNMVERWFESGLKIEPAHTVEQLNEWALDWCIWFNGAKKHSRHKMTRTQCWLRINKDQLRELPEREILQYLFARPGEERLVNGDYTISFRGPLYNLKPIEGLMPGRSKVQVILRPYHWPQVGVVFKDVEYLVDPIPCDDVGFREDAAVIGEEFKSMPETAAQRAKKRADNLAYGENRKKDAIPFEGLRMFGHHAQDVKHAFVPKMGTPIVAESHSHMEDKKISVTAFFKKLIREMGTIPPELNKSIRERYGTSISLAEVNRLLDLAGDRGQLSAADLAYDQREVETKAAI